jgi:hypothetical protein
MHRYKVVTLLSFLAMVITTAAPAQTKPTGHDCTQPCTAICSRTNPPPPASYPGDFVTLTVKPCTSGNVNPASPYSQIVNALTFTDGTFTTVGSKSILSSQI